MEAVIQTPELDYYNLFKCNAVFVRFTGLESIGSLKFISKKQVLESSALPYQVAWTLASPWNVRGVREERASPE